jgi:hypothetical protein
MTSALKRARATLERRVPRSAEDEPPPAPNSEVEARTVEALTRAYESGDPAFAVYIRDPQNCVSRRWLRGLERIHHPLSKILRNGLESSDQVKQKACEVVVPVVQRQPGSRSLDSLDPCTEQRGLPEACRGRDEG